MYKLILAAALAVFAFAAHTQDNEVEDPYASLTDEQIVELAVEKTLAEMEGVMTPGQVAYVAALLSAPEVAAALEADGEYSMDMTDVPMDVSMPQAAIDSWNGSYEDPQFEGYSANDDGAGTIDDPVVATIHCWDFRAADPHKGEGPNRVDVTKAKSRAKCEILPTVIVGWPPPAVVDWELHMVLGQHTWVRIGPVSIPVYLPVGIASHERNGTWNPVWKPDRAGRHYDGTQVFHVIGCVNGRFQNISTLWIEVPPPWYVSRGGFLGLRIQNGRVGDC